MMHERNLTKHISEYVEAAAVLGEQGGLSWAELYYFNERIRSAVFKTRDAQERFNAITNALEEVFRFGVGVGAELKHTRPILLTEAELTRIVEAPGVINDCAR